MMRPWHVYKLPFSAMGDTLQRDSVAICSLRLQWSEASRTTSLWPHAAILAGHTPVDSRCSRVTFQRSPRLSKLNITALRCFGGHAAHWSLTSCRTISAPCLSRARCSSNILRESAASRDEQIFPSRDAKTAMRRNALAPAAVPAVGVARCEHPAKGCNAITLRVHIVKARAHRTAHREGASGALLISPGSWPIRSYAQDTTPITNLQYTTRFYKQRVLVRTISRTADCFL